MTDAGAASVEASDDAASLKAGRPRRFAWIVFSGGLEAFNVPIVYVLFAPYFANRVAENSIEGQRLWAFALSLSGLFAALLAPPLALAAEHPGRRRALLALFVLLNAAATVVFWIAAPGAPMGVVFAVLAAYGVAALSNDLLYVFYASMLPEVAPPRILGRTSGVATAIGWALALTATALFLLAFVWPATPPFGLDKAAGEPERLSGPFAAALMIVFCAPLLLLRAPPAPERPKRSFAVWLKEEVGSLLEEKAAAMAVASRLVYWSGVVLVMSFGNIIATSIMGWSSLGTSVFGLTVLVAGAVGAGIGGVLDDRLGTRNALSLMLAGLGVSLCLILTMSPDRLFAVFPVEPRAVGAAELSSLAEQAVLGLGALTGLFLGTAGPMSRSLIARYSPPDRTARYYGLAAVAGNATNVFGPLMVGLVTTWTQSQRAGLLVAPLFLVLGIFLLRMLPKTGYR